MQNLRGLSNIIAITLIILLTTVAVALLFTSIDKFTNLLSPEFSCLELQVETPITIREACFNQTTQETEITLTRDLQDVFLSEIDFTLDSEQYACGPSCGGNCHILESGNTKTYYFQSQAAQITLSSNNCPLDAQEITIC